MMFDTIENTSHLINFYETIGAKTKGSNGIKLISNFTDIEKEVNIIYNGVGLRDISHYGFIELKGSDVLDYLHRIGASAVKDLPREKVANIVFTSEKGKIIDYSKLINFQDYQILICNRANLSKVNSWLQKYIITDDVKVEENNGKYGLLELVGPQADSFATLISGNVVNILNPDTFKIVNTEGIIYFLMKIMSEDGKMRYWILANLENCEKLLKYVNENKGIFDFSFIGEDSYEIYRIEQGIPAAPNEINMEYNPLEIGLNASIDFNKGCYIGQEVIARLDTYDKVKRRLVGLEFSEPIDFTEKMILNDDKNLEAGTLTSALYSTRLNKQIGLGFVNKTSVNEGTVLYAKSEEKKIQAIVRNLPFVK